MDSKTFDPAQMQAKFKPIAKFTYEQKKAIDADGKVLVSASAGSGKTTTMVEKILRCMAAGTPLSKMLILVYNEAAAGELRDKLQAALFDAACASSGAQRKLFRDNLDSLSSARIGTIHAFCFSLIKENFEKIGVSPACDVLSEGEAKRYDDQAMDEVFGECYESGDEVFMQLADVLTRGRREDELRKVVEKVHAVIAIQPDRKAFAQKLCDGFEDVFEGEYAAAAASFLRRDAAHIRECLEYIAPVYAGAGYPLYAEKCLRLAEEAGKAENAGFKEIADIALTALEAAEMPVEPYIKSVYIDGTDKKFGAEAIEKATKLFAEWEDLFGDEDAVAARHAQNAAFVRKLVELAERTDELSSAMKRADEVMSYEDLEFYAAELVKSGEFAGRYERVFVDEYQDVNPVQDFIIRGVSGEHVFTVGDVKQSIYGFRLSDPEIFLGRKRSYEESGEGRAIEFNANFRSVNAVLDFVNRVFDEVMTVDSSGVDYAEEGHFVLGDDKCDAFGKPLSGAAEVHFFPYARQSAAPGLAAEAKFIAEKIRELRSSATKENVCPISYSDCAVLIRSRSGSARKLAEYLAGEGIPVDMSIFSEQSPRAEKELIGFLTVLDNPRQDIPLAGFMLSCFGGFDENEMACIASLRGENDDLYDAVLAAAEKGGELGKKTAAMLDMLAEYRLKASFKSVPELLQSIVSDFDYAALVSGLGEGSADSVLSFVASAAAGKEQHTDIGRFLAAYEARSDESKRSRPQGGDRVLFATFHSYKGLESPVVFVCCPPDQRDGAGRGGDIMVENKGYMGLRYFDFAGRKKESTLSLYACARIRAERERMEEMRLYYVALTRAQQYLYIVGTLSNTPAERFGLYPSFREPAGLSELLSVLCRRGKIGKVIHEKAEAAPPVSVFRKLPPLGEASPEDEGTIRRATGFVYPHGEASSLAMKYSVSALDGGADDLALSAFADRADEGIAYHKVMEHIDFAAQGKAAVENELEQMVASGLLTEEERAQVDAAAVAKCLASPVMQLARESTCYRERSFLMYVPAREVGQGSSEDKVLVQGVIDLLIDGRERVIVDFKNSALRSEEALRKYKKQLNLYKKAVESSFLGKVDRILLYSFKTGKTLDVERDL